MSAKKPQHPSRPAIAASVTLTVIFAAVLVGLANYLAARHHKTFDFSESQQYSLSETTRNYIGRLKEPVRLYLFFNPENPIYEKVETLLRQYRDAGRGKVEVEVVDRNRDLARTSSLAQQYRLTSADDLVIVDFGGKSKFVSGAEMADIEMGGFQGPGRIKSFKAEEQITSAMVQLTEGQAAKVYFLTGHGEADVTSSDPMRGFSEMNERIKRSNIETAPLNLLLTPAIPDDAAGIVIAGATSKLQPIELELLGDYLKKKNGRLVVFLDAGVDAGLGGLLGEYGIESDNNVVVGAIDVIGVRKLIGTVSVARISDHPIVKQLAGTTLVFNAAQSLRVKEKSQAAGLVWSAPGFWGESQLKGDDAKFDQGKDVEGPVLMAAAVDTGKVKGENVELQGARIVVIGSVLSFTNAQLFQLPGAMDLALNSVNWAVRKEQFLGIAPKETKQFSLGLQPAQIITSVVIICGAIPLSVLLIGIGVWVRRRS
jgi:ABC-type uncharacterized transport system involved in gliding motility auxiliary subunit